MSGKTGMKSPRYSEKMKAEMKTMLAEGKTQKEAAEYFGLKDRFVVHQIMKRERRKEREAAILPKRRGRPQQHPNTSLKALLKENDHL